MYDAPSGTLEPCPQSGHLDAETPQHSHWHQADLCHHHQVCLDPLRPGLDTDGILTPVQAHFTATFFCRCFLCFLDTHCSLIDSASEADDSSIIDVPFDAFLSSAGSGGILRQSI